MRKGLQNVLTAGLAVGTLSLGTGCVSTYDTNLAENLKGKDVTTATYGTERVSLDNKTEYVVGKETRDFLLPSGERYTSDVIMDFDDTMAYEDHGESQITFVPKDPRDQYAVVPINFSKKGGLTVAYVVNPENDKRDRGSLPRQFNIDKSEIPEGFSVEKVKVDGITISQTIDLPKIGNAYLFKNKFSIYPDISLSGDEIESEPVMIVPTDPSKTRNFNDNTNNRRGLEGNFYGVAKLELAPVHTGTEDKTSLSIGDMSTVKKEGVEEVALAKKKRRCPPHTVINNELVATMGLGISCVHGADRDHGYPTFSAYEEAFKKENTDKDFLEDPSQEGSFTWLVEGETYNIPIRK